MKKLYLILFAISINTLLLAETNISFTPAPPKLNNKGYVLLSEASNKIIASQNADTKISPASLTKLMTLFIVANSLEQKTISLNDQVLVSKKAWKQPGSRMFIKAGDHVNLKKLILGSAVVSGNDATVALAEHIAGSVDRFVEIMNQTALKLGMNNTHFANVTGLPSKNHLTTPRDLAILAHAWFKHFPEQTKWFTEKYFKYNKIKQHNRNQMLWSNKNVDGMKTGYTKDAGYCLVTSAKNNESRLIAVITGAKSRSARFEQSAQLLNYGYHFFVNKELAKKDITLGTTEILQGKNNTISYAPEHDVIATIAKSDAEKIELITDINHIKAPIKKGEIIGTATFKIGEESIKTNLVANESMARGNIWQISLGYLKSLIS